MKNVSIIMAPIEQEVAQLKALYINSLSSQNPLLRQVTDHLLLREGKLMRPKLVLLMAKLFEEVVPPATYHAATALELLHSASLMHDDVVDESNERRGLPSIRAAFGNKTAVLSGDYLLATALCEAVSTGCFPICQIISRLGQNLADGELQQLMSYADLKDLESVYYEVIRKKTASLFGVCAQFGAMTAGASDEMAENARIFGEHLGICFQIKDDLFDYFDSPEIGKPTGTDMREGKLSLPAIYALNTHPDPASSAIATKVRSLTATPEEIAQLIEFTKQNGGIDYATKVMGAYQQKALRQLDVLPTNPPIHVALTAYVNCVVERAK